MSVMFVNLHCRNSEHRQLSYYGSATAASGRKEGTSSMGEMRKGIAVTIETSHSDLSKQDG